MNETAVRKQLAMLHGGFDRLEQITVGITAAEENIVALRKEAEYLERELNKDTAATKYVESQALLNRLHSWMADQAVAWGIRPVFYTQARGQLSIAETQRILPVIIAAAKLKIRWLAGEDPLVRYERGLFPASSMGIRIHTNTNGYEMELFSDVLSLHSEPEQWYELVALVAANDGSVERSSISGHGCKIRISIPIATSRVIATILHGSGFELAIPEGIIFVPTAEEECEKFTLDPVKGLRRLDSAELDDLHQRVGVRIGEYKIQIICQSSQSKQQVALDAATEWLDASAWHSSLAICPSHGMAKIFPYVQGIELYRLLEGNKNE